MTSYTSYASTMAERKLSINAFTGVDQSKGEHSADIGSSPDAVNFIARFGDLRTANGVTQYGIAAPVSIYESANGRLYQGFFRDATTHEEFTKIILALHGRIYVSDPGCEEWTAIGAGFTTNDWYAVNYKHETTDWIIFTNGIDTAQYWDGVSAALMPLHMIQGRITQEQPDGTITIINAGEEINFNQITLLHERLWGGVSSTYPDRIYWSNTFDPEDWNLDYEDSEYTGGGFVDVATFDGSRIRAIINAMDDVLIFKDKSLHRLSGTYPGEFQLTQVYGTEGTLAPRTIVSDGSSVYFLASDGLVRYNGMQAAPLTWNGDRKLKDTWSRINDSNIDTACACLVDNVIYMAIPLDGSIINNCVIEYHLLDGTYNILGIEGLDDWLVFRQGQDETILFLREDKIYRYDSGLTFFGQPINAVWTSPWIDCGSQTSRKSTGRIYMTISANSIDLTQLPKIKLSTINEKKTRTKIINLKNGLNIIRKRVKVRGRMFRFRIENVDGNPLTIHRGIEIHIEEDFD